MMGGYKDNIIEGVEFHELDCCDLQNVQKIMVNRNCAVGIVVNGKEKYCDVLVSGADYNHTESLLEKRFRSYEDSY